MIRRFDPEPTEHPAPQGEREPSYVWVVAPDPLEEKCCPTWIAYPLARPRPSSNSTSGGRFIGLAIALRASRSQDSRSCPRAGYTPTSDSRRLRWPRLDPARPPSATVRGTDGPRGSARICLRSGPRKLAPNLWRCVRFTIPHVSTFNSCNMCGYLRRRKQQRFGCRRSVGCVYSEVRAS